VRLSFQFGDATGTVRISEVLLHEAPIYGLRDDEDPQRGSVRRLGPAEFASHTAARFCDEGRFYYELETGYNHEMYRFLKQELKVRALVDGTNHDYRLPCLRGRVVDGPDGLPRLLAAPAISPPEGRIALRQHRYETER